MIVVGLVTVIVLFSKCGTLVVFATMVGFVFLVKWMVFMILTVEAFFIAEIVSSLQVRESGVAVLLFVSWSNTVI